MTNNYRRSARLFEKFINKYATKNVVNMDYWINKKLKESKKIPIRTFTGIIPEKEKIICEIFSTIIYQESKDPSKNDSIFKNQEIIYVMVSRLDFYIIKYGLKWGLKWAIPTKNIILEIGKKRFENSV